MELISLDPIIMSYWKLVIIKSSLVSFDPIIKSNLSIKLEPKQTNFIELLLVLSNLFQNLKIIYTFL